ncbi:MAG TPA: hypothetical protein VEB21_19185, partial [Terriglobales bacterium]|nr:hypothetical protein [Terriglobales bacterium]
RLLAALQQAGQLRQQSFKLHVAGDRSAVPDELFRHTVPVQRSHGVVQELQAEPLDDAELGREWEWEETPELSLRLVQSVDEATDLFNRYSPQFIVSLISSDAAEHDRIYRRSNAPFVGDGFTRWVDGQYAFDRPELGLSNWQNGRLLGRGGVLSGDSVFTARARVRQHDPSLKR